MSDEKFKILIRAIRQALLMMVDALERYLEEYNPRTSELRKESKNW